MERLNSEDATTLTSPSGRGARSSSFTSQQPYQQQPDLSTAVILAIVSGRDTGTVCVQLSEYFRERGATEVGPSGLGRILVVTLIEGLSSPWICFKWSD